MIMCVLLCYPVSIHMSQLQATGRPISSLYIILLYPRRKSGIYWIQVRRAAAAAVEISLWTQ